jgi:hypothetical protein
VQKISELLAKTKIFSESINTNIANSENDITNDRNEVRAVEIWTSQPALMKLFKAPLSTEAAIKQEAKEKQWELHFSEYGRGITIYRTVETAKLVIAGVPQTLRGEVWLTFSGTCFKVITLTS